MKKKLLSLIIAITLMATVAVTFTACEIERHINPLCCFDGANVISFDEQEEYYVLPYYERYGLTFIAHVATA